MFRAHLLLLGESTAEFGSRSFATPEWTFPAASARVARSPRDVQTSRRGGAPFDAPGAGDGGASDFRATQRAHQIGSEISFTPGQGQRSGSEVQGDNQAVFLGAVGMAFHGYFCSKSEKMPTSGVCQARWPSLRNGSILHF